MKLDKSKIQTVQNFYSPVMRSAVILPVSGGPRGLVVIVGTISGAGVNAYQEIQDQIKEVARGLELSVSQADENKNTKK